MDCIKISLILFIWSQTSTICKTLTCMNCIGHNCYLPERVSWRDGASCFIYLPYWGVKATYRGTWVGDRTSPRVLECKTEKCNEIFPEYPPLLCLECEVTEDECYKLTECGFGGDRIAPMCFSVYVPERNKIKKGCSAYEDPKTIDLYYGPHMEVFFEFCESHECNSHNRFLHNNGHSLNSEHHCQVCEPQLKNCRVEICPERNRNDRYFKFCYYNHKTEEKGCLTRRYYDREKRNIQICMGPSCNININNNTLTKCLNKRKQEVVCLRFEDPCSILEGHFYGCYHTEPGYGWIGKLCKSGFDCTKIEATRRGCYVCSDSPSCDVIRTPSVYWTDLCKEGEQFCYSDQERRERGCGKGHQGSSKFCEGDTCNSDPFGIYCYSCSRLDPDCAGFEMEKFQIDYCAEELKCYTKIHPYGRVERGCGPGPSGSEVCDQPMCNKKPMETPQCHRYTFWSRERIQVGKKQHIEPYFVPCEKLPKLPLCYTLYNESIVSGGCSSVPLASNQIDIVQIAGYHDQRDMRLKYVFCDTAKCNYLDAKSKSTN